MIDHDAICREANALEPLPRTVHELTRLFQAEDWDAYEVINIVRYDPALAGKILRLANSAWKGGPQAVGNLSDAIMRVGSQAVLAMGLASAVKPMLDTSLGTYGMDPQGAWREAIAATTFMEVLRERFPGRFPEEGPAIAILHNIGKIVLERVVPESERRYLQAALDHGVELVEAESELFEVTYPEVGALVARYWGLPGLFVRTVQYQMRPESIPTNRGADLALGHGIRLAVLSGRAIDRDLDVMEFDGWRDSLAYLGFLEADWEECLEQTRERMEHCLACFAE